MNQRICQTFPLLTGTFASINEYISVIVAGKFYCKCKDLCRDVYITTGTGPSSGVPCANAAACLQMIQSRLTDIKNVVDGM